MARPQRQFLQHFVHLEVYQKCAYFHRVFGSPLVGDNGAPALLDEMQVSRVHTMRKRGESRAFLGIVGQTNCALQSSIRFTSCSRTLVNGSARAENAVTGSSRAFRLTNGPFKYGPSLLIDRSMAAYENLLSFIVGCFFCAISANLMTDLPQTYIFVQSYFSFVDCLSRYLNFMQESACPYYLA